MKIQASSFATFDNDSFPSAFVEYSTDMSVQAGQEAPVSFNMRFSIKGGSNSE